MRLFVLLLVFIICGCATLPPDMDKFYEVVGASCAPSPPSEVPVIVDGKVVTTIKIASDQRDTQAKCEAAWRYSFKTVGETPTERVLAGFNDGLWSTGKALVHQSPYAMGAYGFYQLGKQTGNTIVGGDYAGRDFSKSTPTATGSYNTDQSNQGNDSSNRPVTTTNTYQNDNRVDSRTNYDNDSRTNYDNPVTQIVEPEVMP